ncbi:hypothetical protein PILCRDRAFT_811596 [Piloderma croceum F 1598]|uniref:AAA+ ATPase domain-containing protein n=1 Tax=Piloderma croceum (strain F 1598) TaxID=765440 RepID=A0A0C3G457_PILCF|nr:hypothetical protein PILCRDRAFT_811596 [Piloderma croceum F 1598]
MPSNVGSLKDLDSEDAFVNVMFQEERNGETVNKGNDSFYDKFVEMASAKYADPAVQGASSLRQLYPNHSLVMSADYGLNLTSLPGASALPLSPSELVTNVLFVPIARRLGSVPGVLLDNIVFGGFKVAWNTYDFIIYTARWQIGFSLNVQHFILHEGPEDAAREFILAAGIWREQLHDEIWVFNQGFWNKDHGLWTEIQKADWKDVVLKDKFKKNLQKDIYGFFASEAVYKELAIPWKRGLIMYGPPGNGKTISIKAVMKSCDEKGFRPLYVKSFQSYKGEEGAMADVFDKARQLSPCVVVLEDLDSLINDRNRSFFLNQLDGLESNDGLLVIGTTNHFEKLDPGLSMRPSRFDRKYLFDDPDRDERALYAKYWQDKLKDNKDISYPDSLVDEVASSTGKFSFAYLKEVFVSSLVLLAGFEGEHKPDFASVIKGQIKALRQQLDKSFGTFGFTPVAEITSPHPEKAPGRDIRALLDELSNSIARTDNDPPRVYTTIADVPGQPRYNGAPVRMLLDALSESAGSAGWRSAAPSNRIYTTDVQGSADTLPMPGSMPRKCPPLDDGRSRYASEMYKPLPPSP